MDIPVVHAFLFDLDGTLVNTEPIHRKAWLDILAQKGIIYDEHWFEQWIGTSDRFLAQNVIEVEGLDASPRELQVEKAALFHALASRQARTFEEVSPTLAYLRQRFPIAIATNSSLQDATAIFTATHLQEQVDTVCTADDVERLKPAPDIYLLAAERLGCAPAHCLVVEDSPAGSEAARAAGMYVVGLTSSLPAEKMAFAHRLFQHPNEAFRWIKNTF